MTPPRGEIAIVGMACTFPGARDLRQYWENILRKHDAVSDPPAEWEASRYYDPNTDRNDRTYCKRGGYLGDLARFDPTLYGVMPQSVDGTEPDHFLALRAASEALADSGYLNNPKYRESTSIIIGRGTYVNRGNTTAVQHSLGVDSVLDVLRQLHPEYTAAELELIRTKLHDSLPPFDSGTAPGLVPNIISGRIANRLDIMGPNYIVDAACASSLVAVELGVRDLLSGHSDMVIAGGVHASTPPVILIIFSQLKALSRAGKIKPFGGDADGTLLGEGVGMVVLKRVADAERDGDRIYAVIKGVGTASDGRALGLLAPRLEGEVLALRRAYDSAGVDPATVGLIEAHGTATLVGDATEIEALKSILGGRRGELPRCALGSVKSMISHTMPASGMAGMIKAALALHHKILPPTLHCEDPNPKLGLETSDLYLNTETRPWIHGAATPRRAGVNAFGFGGINAHAVLEEYTGTCSAPWLQHDWPTELFVFSADSREALAEELEQFSQLVASAPESVPLHQLAYTSVAKPLGTLRISIVTETREALLEKLGRAAAKLKDPKVQRIREKDGIYFFAAPMAATGKIAFLFPGEGGQYPGMLADLAMHFPEVREWFDLMDAAFAGHPRGYLPSDAAFPPPATESTRLWSMDVGAETVFCSNMALFTLLDKLGVKPHAMVGHSTGEHSALLASSVVSLPSREDRIRYVLGVNDVFERLKGEGEIQSGVLLTVAGASRKFLDELVSTSNGALYVALDNCPNQVVICGSEEHIAAAEARLTARSAICQRLWIDRAYHTPQFASFVGALRKYLDTVPFALPDIALYSCVSAGRFPDNPDVIRDLACRSWAETVRFREAVEAMHADGVRIFVECGPRGNLTGFVADSLRGKEHLALQANVQHRPGITQIQHLLGMLVAHGVNADFTLLHSRRVPVAYKPQAAARKRPSLHIASGLQALRLPADFAPLHKESPPVPAAAAPVPPAAAAPTPAAPVPPAAAAPTPAASPLPDAMQAYFSNMRQFLAVNQQVFQSFAAASMAARSEVPSAVPAATQQPFLSEVLEQQPGVRARVLCRLPLDRFPVFGDHTLGRSVSISEPSLNGLPVVPLTVTMEILAEAASLVMPGQILTGLSRFSSSRWITLESQVEFEITARAEEPTGSVRVQMRPSGTEPIRPIWAECAASFGSVYPPAPTPAAFALQPAHASSWRPDRLYIDGMFHGPTLQAVRSVDRSAPNGNTSTLDVLRRDQLIAGTPRPGFQIDPVILDAAGQCVAFWTQEEYEPHGDIFPFYFDRLLCFGPPAPEGSQIECRVMARTVNDTEVHSDIELLYPANTVLYRIENWKDRRFLLPQMFWDLRTKGGRVPLAEPWPGIPGGYRCDLSSELLEASHGIWAKMLAHVILGPAERQQWLELSSAVPKRRSDWLRGRCAAKEAIRQLLRDERGVQLLGADIQLIPSASGKPMVHIAAPQAQGLQIDVSISHSGGVAGAVAVSHGRAGFDMESMERASADLGAIAFSPSELQRLNATANRQEWQLRAWCAKEAVLKQTGEGFRHGFHSVEIQSLDEKTGEIELKLGDEVARSFTLLSNRTQIVRTVRQGSFILATIPQEAKSLS